MTIPLTVIGGFLGAGKTTLLNHLLAHATKRYGVLVNDFGAINIDAALIAAQDGASIALTNGCVCCSLGEDLGDGLATLARRDPPPEHVIVEASGVSDPWRIAQLALIETGFTLEPLIVMVDGVGFLDQLADRWVADTVARQLAFAELVVISKADLVGDLGPVRREIARLRPEARVIDAIGGALDPAVLRFAPPRRGTVSRFAAEPVHDFPTASWRPAGPLDRVRLRAVLEGLPKSVLRLKGFCQIGAEGDWYLLQYAAERWAFTRVAGPEVAGFVVIGTPGMPDAAAIAALFVGCLLPAEALR
ncbi:MAG: GTP-binding protein [Alphaproteobacteria bacterium]|nr:GTP-binding protein [Alphaproteobacteria bacterium]